MEHTVPLLWLTCADTKAQPPATPLPSSSPLLPSIQNPRAQESMHLPLGRQRSLHPHTCGLPPNPVQQGGDIALSQPTCPSVLGTLGPLALFCPVLSNSTRVLISVKKVRVSSVVIGKGVGGSGRGHRGAKW